MCPGGYAHFTQDIGRRLGFSLAFPLGCIFQGNTYKINSKIILEEGWKIKMAATFVTNIRKSDPSLIHLQPSFSPSIFFISPPVELWLTMNKVTFRKTHLAWLIIILTNMVPKEFWGGAHSLVEPVIIFKILCILWLKKSNNTESRISNNPLLWNSWHSLIIFLNI